MKPWLNIKQENPRKRRNINRWRRNRARRLEHAVKVYSEKKVDQPIIDALLVRIAQLYKSIKTP